MESKKISFHYQVGCNGSSNGRWNLELCQKWHPQSSASGNAILWNLGPLGIHAAQPYIAQAMRKKAAIVTMQEILIPQGSKFRVQQEFRWKYPEYE